MDYSFIRLKDNFGDAKNIGDSPVSTHFKYECIQLSPNEAYLQITNVDGGISFNGDYLVEIVDCSNIPLADVTGRVFIEEFVSNGVNQLSFEIVNLGVDFYRKTVYLRFTHTISNVVYWSNPLNITDYEKEHTTYFQYKNYNNFLGIGYTSAQKYQSIRIRTYFDIPVNNTEIQDYYQITRQATISARALVKKFERYQIDYINSFTYERLNGLLIHDIIYVDCVRMTNKTSIESDDREGDSNWFVANFTIAKNYSDKKEYEYQIFEGLNAIEFLPIGSYTLAGILATGNYVVFNTTSNIVIHTGTITLYDSLNNIIDTFTEADITTDENEMSIFNLTDNIVSNGVYHIKISDQLVSAEGIYFVGINDDTTWVFTVVDADYSSLDYNSNDYFTA